MLNGIIGLWNSGIEGKIIFLGIIAFFTILATLLSHM